MATSTYSRTLLVSAGAAALAGTALAMLLASNIVGIAGAGTSADKVLLAVDASPICGTPVAGGPPLMLRFAQTEVPRAEMSAASAAPAFADTEPPLWNGLGSITWKITTANEKAQTYFDQGLRLAYAFNHNEAQRAFRKAQKLDPDCAMCFWGEAYVLRPNINLPMQEDAVAPAYAAAQKAKALAAKASPREQALIDAIAVRYSSDPKADRKPLDAAYAAGMAKAAAKFSDDNDIATLYAEAVMDLSPWDYWKPGGREPNPQSVPIVPTLERVLTRNPNHPGAIHFYIHAVEASDRPKRAEPYADRLRNAIPGAGHLVHMPSHIYYRVGRYLDALKDNKEAVSVDEKMAHRHRRADGRLPVRGYYPHNVHFVMASARMAGDGQTVIAAAEKLGRSSPTRPPAAHRDGAAGESRAVFRACAVQHARRDPGAARSRRCHSLCQGDVALRARCGTSGATRFCGRDRFGWCDRNAGAHLRFQAAQGIQYPGAGSAAHRAHPGRRANGAGQGRQIHRHQAVRAGGGAAGRPALYRTTLLVLSDQAIIGGSTAASRPLRRGEGAIRTCTPPRAGQWLVVLRTDGVAQGAR